MISDRLSPHKLKISMQMKTLQFVSLLGSLKHIGLKEMLAEIPDHRQGIKKVYSNDSLLLWALSVFFSAGIKKFVKHDHFGFAYLQTKFSFKLLRGSRTFIAKERLR